MLLRVSLITLEHSYLKEEKFNLELILVDLDYLCSAINSYSDIKPRLCTINNALTKIFLINQRHNLTELTNAYEMLSKIKYSPLLDYYSVWGEIKHDINTALDIINAKLKEY